MLDRIPPPFALDAAAGRIHLVCASIAIRLVDDVHSQAWYAKRLHDAVTGEQRVIFFPSPLATPETLLELAFEGHPALSGHPVYEAARRRREACDRTAVVGYERGETIVSHEDYSYPQESQVVADWLNALPEEDPRLLDKLPRLSWAQGVEHAKRWHARLLAQRAEGVAGDLGTVDRLDVAAMPGWYWVHLISKRALDNEGSVMGHCVGSGFDYMTWQDGVRPEGRVAECGIWSLRDPTGRSKVTVEIGYDGIQQAQGPGNDRPMAETVPAFAALIPRFLVEDEFFDTPYWLIRENDGSTRLRTDDEAQADLRSLPRYGQVFFRMPSSDGWADIGDVDGFRIDMPVTRRDRFARQGRPPVAEAVTTQIDTEIRMRPIGISTIVEAISRMCEADIVDAIVGTCRPAAQMEEILYTAPAFVSGPNRRERHEARQPWYRRHERQQHGRAAR